MSDDIRTAGHVPKIIAEARERFHDCAEAEEPQRKSSLEAKRFLALDQWPDDIKIQRQGGIAVQGQPAQPPRPCLTLDCVSEPHQQVVNAILSADFAVKVSPKQGAPDQNVEIIEGLLRHIQNQARDDAPVEWASDNAAGCGIGWFALKSQYCDSESFDQELILHRIENCLSVYCDPSAVSPTRKDARFMFVTEDIPKGEFKRRWPDADLKALEDFRASGDDNDKWVDQDSIRIANYWRVEEVPDTLYELTNGQVVRRSALSAEPEKALIVHTRETTSKRILCDTINACESLESYEWGRAGLTTRIPIFPIFGQHMNVDGKQIEFGVTQRAIGPQQMVNFTFSGSAETVALAPKSPFLVAEGQFESYETIWANANRYNYSYLPYRRFAEGSNQDLGVPQRNQAEPPIQAMAMVMQMSLDAVRRTTSFDPALGQMPGRTMSADAIEALQKQGDTAHSNYLNSVRRSLLAFGECALEAIPVYYDRPGRIVQILDLENKATQVMLNQPHVSTSAGPQALPQGQAPPQGQDVQHFDLSKGRYSCTVEVGRAFTTRRQEGVAALGELAKVAPELVPKFADVWVGAMDFPEAQAIAQRLQPPGLANSDLPPQAQAQIAQLQQALQHLQQIIATDEAKAMAKAKANIMEAQAKAQLPPSADAQLNAQTGIMKQRISTAGTMSVGLAKVDAENQRSFVDAFEARLAHEEGFRFEIAKAVIGHMVDQQGRDHEAQHAIVGQALDHAHDHAMAERAHQQTLEQTAQAAALAPPPDAGAGASA